MNPLFIIIIIFLTILIVTFIVLIVDPTIQKGITKGLGEHCTATVDCHSGLVCSSHEEMCMIPEGGACFWDPDYCIGSTVCYKDTCVKQFKESTDKTHTVSLPIKVMPPVRR